MVLVESNTVPQPVIGAKIAMDLDGSKMTNQNPTMTPIRRTATQIAKELLEAYAAPYHVGQPHQREKTVLLAASSAELRIVQLIHELYAGDSQDG